MAWYGRRAVQIYQPARHCVVLPAPVFLRRPDCGWVFLHVRRSKKKEEIWENCGRRIKVICWTAKVKLRKAEKGNFCCFSGRYVRFVFFPSHLLFCPRGTRGSGKQTKDENRFELSYLSQFRHGIRRNKVAFLEFRYEAHHLILALTPLLLAQHKGFQHLSFLSMSGWWLLWKRWYKVRGKKSLMRKNVLEAKQTKGGRKVSVHRSFN